jgi:hypothetical protein
LEESCDTSKSFLSAASPEVTPVSFRAQTKTRESPNVVSRVKQGKRAAPVEHACQRRKASTVAHWIRRVGRISVLPAYRSFVPWLLQWFFLALVVLRRALTPVKLLIRKWTDSLHSCQLRLRRLLSRSVHRSILPALRSLRICLSQWRDHFRSLLKSIRVRQLPNFGLRWLRERIRIQSRLPHFSFCRGRISVLTARRFLTQMFAYWCDHRLSLFASTPWRRLMAFVLLWLKKPIGTVHWCQVHPHGYLIPRSSQKLALPRK